MPLQNNGKESIYSFDESSPSVNENTKDLIANQILTKSSAIKRRKRRPQNKSILRSRLGAINTSFARVTLQKNNQALASALQNHKHEIKMMQDNNLYLQEENHELRLKYNAILRDQQLFEKTYQAQAKQLKDEFSSLKQKIANDSALMHQASRNIAEGLYTMERVGNFLDKHQSSIMDHLVSSRYSFIDIIPPEAQNASNRQTLLMTNIIHPSEIRDPLSGNIHTARNDGARPCLYNQLPTNAVSQLTTNDNNPQGMTGSQINNSLLLIKGKPPNKLTHAHYEPSMICEENSMMMMTTVSPMDESPQQQEVPLSSKDKQDQSKKPKAGRRSELFKRPIKGALRPQMVKDQWAIPESAAHGPDSSPHDPSGDTPQSLTYTLSTPDRTRSSTDPPNKTVAGKVDTEIDPLYAASVRLGAANSKVPDKLVISQTKEGQILHFLPLQRASATTPDPLLLPKRSAFAPPKDTVPPFKSPPVPALLNKMLRDLRNDEDLSHHKLEYPRRSSERLRGSQEYRVITSGQASLGSGRGGSAIGKENMAPPTSSAHPTHVDPVEGKSHAKGLKISAALKGIKGTKRAGKKVVAGSVVVVLPESSSTIPNIVTGGLPLGDGVGDSIPAKKSRKPRAKVLPDGEIVKADSGPRIRRPYKRKAAKDGPVGGEEKAQVGPLSSHATSPRPPATAEMGPAVVVGVEPEVKGPLYGEMSLDYLELFDPDFTVHLKRNKGGPGKRTKLKKAPGTVGNARGGKKKASKDATTTSEHVAANKSSACDDDDDDDFKIQYGKGPLSLKSTPSPYKMSLLGPNRSNSEDIPMGRTPQIGLPPTATTAHVLASNTPPPNASDKTHDVTLSSRLRVPTRISSYAYNNRKKLRRGDPGTIDIYRTNL